MKRSISDDDLCAECYNLFYNPGNLSECSVQENEEWPCTCNQNGYAIDCPKYKECEPGTNWLTEEA